MCFKVVILCLCFKVVILCWKFKVSFSKPLLEVFCEIGVLRNCVKFPGKHLRQSLFFNKVAGLCNFI